MSVDKYIQRQNITGDLAKILKGEEVTLPEDFETIDAYQEQLHAAHEAERTEVILEKNLPGILKERLDKEQKNWYAATANPLRNRAVTLGGYSKEEVADIPLSDLLEKVINDNKAKIEEIKQSKATTKSENIEELNSANATIETLKAQIQDNEDRLKVELEKKETEKEIGIHEYVYQRELIGFLSGIKEELTCGSIDQTNDSVEGSLRRHGYELKAEKNQDGKYDLVPYHKNGSKAMDLAKNKFVSTKELILELAAKDKYLKLKNVDEKIDIPGVGSNVIMKGDKKIVLTTPKFLQQG